MKPNCPLKLFIMCIQGLGFLLLLLLFNILPVVGDFIWLLREALCLLKSQFTSSKTQIMPPC